MQEKNKRALSFSIVARPVFPSLLQLPELAGIALSHSLLLSQLCYILYFADAVERCHSEFGGPLKLVCNGGVLWTRGLSILQLVVLEGRWDTVVQCVW